MPIMFMRRLVPPDSAVRNSSSAKMNTKLLKIELSPESTDPIWETNL
jgi:hypothetical protein